MRVFKSLTFRIVFMFIIIIAPMTFLLFYINFYSMNVVKNQVSQSYGNILPIYIQKADDSLDEIRNYLIRMVVNQNSELSVFAMPPPNTDTSDNSEYMLQVQEEYTKLSRDLLLYSSIDSFFVYSPVGDRLLIASISNTNYDKKENLIQTYLDHFIKGQLTVKPEYWNIEKIDGKYILIKVIYDNTGVYMGACVDLNSIISARNFKGMSDGSIIVLTGEGEPLSVSSYSGDFLKNVGAAIETHETENRIITDPKSGNKYLVVSSGSNRADLIFAVAVHERDMLKNLPLFQLTIYILPFVFIIILFLYYMTIQRVLMRPIGQLVGGMKKVAGGGLGFSLRHKGTNEFEFLFGSFNNMVEQIHKLKIDVYEEKIKGQRAELEAQKAELRHLQVQINPHFYANSLNAIYSLAALKDFKAVQGMALHLADYFRYIIKREQNFTELSSEINHILNYLKIQKFRFTNKLNFEICIPEKFASYRIPPLTIQPFVENAIVHGFADRAEPLNITVSVEESTDEGDKYFEVWVRDDGVGFPGEFLEYYSGSMTSKKSNDQHIGISNVYSRLFIMYKGQAGITFRNGDNGGAMVRIRYPVNFTERQDV